VAAFGSSTFAEALSKSKAFAWLTRFCFGASVLLIASGLWRWGAVEVRGHLDQVFWLSLLGLLWLFVFSRLFSWLGLSIADDAIERRNPAALAGLCGGILALALIYTGGSLGEGPSYWNNIFSAGLGTLGFLLLWFLLEILGHVSASIAEERDFASGIRVGGFLSSTGLILGRAVAGDWHSGSATVHDFLHDGWPAVARQWLKTRVSISLMPGHWVAQRRFESVPVPTPGGPRHVCVGVYTVNGRTAGAYARLAEKPLIDFAAVDVALLIEQDD
jgi:hypothetical protein